MEGSDDEFEPLFDYSRIQPVEVVCLEDDSSDGVMPFGNKKGNISEAPVEKQEKNGVNVEATVKDVLVIDDEEEWLPPPPKINKFYNHDVEVDSTLKALRLKKQELASFAESAEDVMRAVEESIRKDLDASQQTSSPNTAAKEPPEPGPERPKLVISIQDKDGAKQYRVFTDDKFERLFGIYADRIKVDAKDLVFLFDGDKVSPMATPDSLGMEENDIIEVHLKPS